MVVDLKEPLNLTQNAITVLEKRYLKKDKNGNSIEMPSEMFWRVASTIAEADKKFGKDKTYIDSLSQDFYKLMTDFEFMPNSPTLMNAGRELGQLSACFVLPVEDSLEGIFETLKNTALIHKSGGGTGFSFSNLRPKNDVVRSTMGVSSGPISFIEVFNAATESVKQGGTRRGANMGILRVDHPDILEFINAKFEGDKLNNFNISVGITNKFMEAVEKGKKYDLIHPKSGEVVNRLEAREVFDLIVNHAWKNGEPGIVFLDALNADNPTPQIGKIESTNPCGEVPLLPYEACNLGSVNLNEMMLCDNEGNIQVDWDRLKKATKLAIHFLDNVIEVNNYPLPQIADMVAGNRKIGLGVMGWANMLMKMNIPYNTEEGTKLAYQIMEFIDFCSKEKSIELAEERGKFPNFEGSIYEKENPLFNKYKGKSAGIITDEDWKKLDLRIKEYGIRNATTTCIAPTGTISMIAGASGGVEPLFSLAFIRNIMDGTELIEVDPVFKGVAEQRGFYSEELMKKIIQKGTVHNVEGVPDDIQTVYVTAHDVSPEWHVKMQGAFQLHTDNAVSKTVNFEEHATREDIAKTYMLAYQSGLKGTTVYRNNSRVFQPMNLDKKQETEQISEGHLKPRKRQGVTFGLTDEIETGCGTLYVTINCDDEGPCEVFARMGKSGGCATSQAEATGRMISLALRARVEIESIIKQLKGIRCPAPALGKGGVVLSCSDAISKVLERNIPRINEITSSKSLNLESQKSVEISGEATSKADLGLCPDCPECGNMLEFGEGCVICKNCGFSRCS
ncbi:MAG: vitamin B12-dependent ribonucleotide reductase [Candidatus Gastranaerophilales bacterium]|nr:vitamin B12-dependent ribonucleotide reductase [Candidatus Gastranaerophilales bacterium]